MTSPTMLLSWRDVAERIKRQPSDDGAVLNVEVDRFGVRVYTDDSEMTLTTLARMIGAPFDPSRGCVDLVGPQGVSRTLPVELFPAAEAPLPIAHPQRPLWSTEHIDVPEFAKNTPSTNDGIAAFFSFKGGVGRTTACFATVVRLLDRPNPPRVLYIDADVEAPGLTWFVNHEERLSWVDAMALMQDADDWRADALPLIAEQIALSTVGLELSSGRREFFLIPAVRGLSQLVEMPVTMENLIRRRGHSWAVGDLLVALRERLQLDAIVIDLRAGLTEMSSPLLLDPRVHSVLVTSCSPQSVNGIVFAMEQADLRASWPLSVDMLVTQVPPSGDARFHEVRQELVDAWARERGKQDSDDESVPEPARIDFEQQLIVFDGMQKVADRLQGTTLWRAVESIAERLCPQEVVAHRVPGGVVSSKTIAQLARRYEYAERSASVGLLATPPLKNLARLSAGQLPASVVIGSKGAGKTFAWAQLVIAGQWAGFARHVGVTLPKGDDATIFPLLKPLNIGDGLQAAVQRAENSVATPRVTSAEIGAKFHSLASPEDAPRFWLNAIAERLDLPEGASRSVRELDSAIRDRGQRVVVVVDGLEDALQSGPGNPMKEAQQVALRALLVQLVNELRELRAQHLGLVVFVRQDIAREAIVQNYGQFAARHEDVALLWSPEDALRLVLWILDQAGWPLLPPKDVASAPYEKLAVALYPFWGKKLGGSRDSFTARWVIAALSDLKGRFQARDLVRLLQLAAEGSEHLPLSPRAIRAAIEVCSVKKIDELETEIASLRPVFTKLRDIPGDARTIPLPREKLSLSDAEVEFMRDLGLLIFDEREQLYYMPEIIRHGLGFGLSRVGRARVLGLQQLALRQQRK